MAALSRWVLALMIAVAVLFSVLLLADDARAQPLQCGPAERVIESLVVQYGEGLVSSGAGPNGTRMMIFAHPDGDTWTFLGILPDGQACFIASGTEFRVAPPTPAGSET